MTIKTERLAELLAMEEKWELSIGLEIDEAEFALKGLRESRSEVARRVKLLRKQLSDRALSTAQNPDGTWAWARAYMGRGFNRTFDR